MTNTQLNASPNAASTLPQAQTTARYSAPAILDLGESKEFFKGSSGTSFDNPCISRQSTASVLN